MTSDDKFNEAEFKLLPMDDQMEYYQWMATLVEFDCSCLEELTEEELEMKLFRMYQSDINRT